MGSWREGAPLLGGWWVRIDVDLWVWTDAPQGGVCISSLFPEATWRVMGEWEILAEGQLDLWRKFSILTPGISFLAPTLTPVFCFCFCFFGRTMACGISVPRPGIEPGPRQWEHEVLTTGPPANSYLPCFLLRNLSNLQRSWANSSMNAIGQMANNLPHLLSPSHPHLFPVHLLMYLLRAIWKWDADIIHFSTDPLKTKRFFYMITTLVPHLRNFTLLSEYHLI